MNNNKGYTYVAMLIVIVIFLASATMMIGYSNFSSIGSDDDLTPQKVIDYTKSLKSRADDREALIDAALEEADNVPVKSANYVCRALFAVLRGPELTASEFYSGECAGAVTKTECRLMDVYDSVSGTFGDEDGLPDCEWVSI